ncbi:MAG: GyrI-like domain-containing protein [Clostridiaceae bacterium]
MNIEVVERKYQPTLCIKTSTSMEKLPELIEKSYHRIMEHMEEIGEELHGEPYVGYFHMEIQRMDVEIGIPVGKFLPGKDDIIPGEIPEGTVVTALYQGPYRELKAAYDEVIEWISVHGYKPTGTAYEIYYNSPAEVKESELLTRIEFPINRVKVENI